MEKETEYDLVIVGAGVSGAAQLYAAAKYTDIKKIALFEKESNAGFINSSATNNSQTLHEGDIETNYNLEKATAVKYKSGFTRAYLEGVEQAHNEGLYLTWPKMVFGVGTKEVSFLKERFVTFKDLFPGLEQIGKDKLAKIEPKMMQGRSLDEDLIALYNRDGITVDYGKLAAQLISDAKKEFAKTPDRVADIHFNTKVEDVAKTQSGYSFTVDDGAVNTRYLSVAAGAHSMYFAKKLGLADVAATSLLLVAGNFYYTPKFLNTKVYTVQNPKLPFSAVHGDPDILNKDTKSRYGPTTRIVASLERGRWNTVSEYFSTLSPVFKSLLAYMRIMFDREFFFYAFRHNVLFSIPMLGNYLFVQEIKKIIPTIKYKDLERAKGQGGVRPQIVQTAAENPLNLGEAKLAGEGVLFNVTPSPGASTCVYNGLVDVRTIALALDRSFDEMKLEEDFGQKLE